MDINVVADDGTNQEPVEAASHDAAPASPLATLRAIREQKINALQKAFKVPRWDDDGGPTIRVTYKPIDAGEMDRAATKRRKANPRPADWMVLYNCDLLIRSCVKIEADLNGETIGRWTSFGPDLADDLGIPKGMAETVVRGLYLTDGDVMTTFRQLATWSGLALPDAEDDALGE